MRKFECNGCEVNCKLTVEMDEIRPTYCLYDKRDIDWYEIKEENTQQFGKTEQLPDWVKVGAFCYNKTHKKYGKITRIQYDMLFDVINFDNTKSICGVGIFSEEYVQARKRPFNADEMKALLGKIITSTDGDVSIITDYSPHSAEYNVASIYFIGGWSTADELLKDNYTIAGKPCYVLEHLNEKGEWVE